MNRTARCSCGDLEIELSGDPKLIVACNCLSCQKRTGSVLGVGAYFDDDQVVCKKGEGKSFTEVAESGRSAKKSFCPNCGSTVYWEAEFQPNRVGVAVGCFEDPKFPEPTVAAWTRSKHEWIQFPAHWPSSQTQNFKKNA
jgi:hypothetical protein